MNIFNHLITKEEEQQLLVTPVDGVRDQSVHLIVIEIRFFIQTL
jgi:hypothetical protein